jgi:hypothetical protein
MYLSIHLPNHLHNYLSVRLSFRFLARLSNYPFINLPLSVPLCSKLARSGKYISVNADEMFRISVEIISQISYSKAEYNS